MGILSSLSKAIARIVKNVVHVVWNFVKKFWWLILIVVAIYYAPAIAVWLAENQAPAWLTTLFEGIAKDVTPYLAKALAWTSKVKAGLGQWWEQLGFWYKTAAVTGTMFLLAPEEMQAVAKEVTEEISHGVEAAAEAAGKAGAAALSGVAAGLGSGSGLVGVAVAAAAWWIIVGKRRHDQATNLVVVDGQSGSDSSEVDGNDAESGWEWLDQYGVAS